MPVFFKDVVLGFRPVLKSIWAVQIELYAFKEENEHEVGWVGEGKCGWIWNELGG